MKAGLWDAPTVQKKKFSIIDFFSKCDKICKKLWIWSQLLKKLLIDSFIFCAASPTTAGFTQSNLHESKISTFYNKAVNEFHELSQQACLELQNIDHNVNENFLLAFL